MRFSARAAVLASALAFMPTFAGAQTLYGFPPPGPGTPVDFVACPERTAGGSWVVTDPVNYYTYSLAGAPVLPNLYVRVTGMTSPQLIDVPGWALAPRRVIVGQTPCRSTGVLQPVNWTAVPAYGPLFPFLPRF